MTNRAVYCIDQDKKTGKIWLGTVDGLNRLDGYRIKQFFYQPFEKYSLSDNAVKGFYFSKKGEMWVSTETGVSKFNKKKNCFENPFFGQKTNINNEFNASFFEHNKKLWIFGGAHYFSLDAKGKLVQHNYLGNEKIGFAKNRRYDNVFKDKCGTIYTSQFNTLMALDPKTLLPKTKFETGETDPITGILDDKTHFWISFWNNKICRIDKNDQSKKQTFEIKANIILSTDFYFLKGKKYIVLGTNLGYAILDCATYKIKEYVTGYQVDQTFVDQQNRLWFNNGGGAMYAEPELPGIETQYVNDEHVAPFGKLKETHKHISGFYSTKKYYYATIIYANGLLVYNKNWELVNYIPSFSKDMSNIARRDFYCVYESANSLWIAAHNEGLYKVNQKHELVKVLLPSDQFGDLDGVNRVAKIYPFRKNKLLIHTFNSLYFFDLKTEKFSDLFHPKQGAIGNFLNQFIVGISVKDDDIYIAQENGLSLLNLKTKKIKQVDFPIHNKRLRHMVRHKDNLWIASQTGLFCYDIQTKKTKGYFRKNGMASDHILSLCLTKNNQLWVATTNGLSLLDLKNYSIKNFNESNGLIDNLMNGDLFLDDKQRLLFSNHESFSMISAKFYENKEKALKSQINEIIVNGENFEMDFSLRDKTIQLKPHQNNLILHFSIPSKIDPYQRKYYYAINGKWQSSSTGQIQLLNLSDGEYKIDVGNLPKSSTLFDTMTIIIQAPFYKTWWFISIFILLIAAIIYFIYQNRLKKEREKLALENHFQLQVKHIEMQLLRSQMNPHFIFNSLNSINSFIIQNDPRKASSYLTMFAKLMRNILDNSKETQITLKKELDTFQLYVKLEMARLDNRFDYELQLDENLEAEMISVPPLILQPFAENAIWHGLQHKKTQGLLRLNVEKCGATCMKISLEDNGIGRAASKIINQSKSRHKSFGLNATIERITNLHPLNAVNILDLVDEKGEVLGTKVEILIQY